MSSRCFNFNSGLNFSEDLSPGVDAVLPAEGVFHRQPAVVELQGGEAALVQADHVPVGQGVAVGVVTWRHVQRHCVTTGPGGQAG